MSIDRIGWFKVSLNNTIKHRCTIRILGIGGSTRRKQLLHLFPIAGYRRVMQRNGARKHLCQVVVSLFTGELDRCLTIVVERHDVGACLHQMPGNFGVTVGSGHMQQRCTRNIVIDGGIVTEIIDVVIDTWINRAIAFSAIFNQVFSDDSHHFRVSTGYCGLQEGLGIQVCYSACTFNGFSNFCMTFL